MRKSNLHQKRLNKIRTSQQTLISHLQLWFRTRSLRFYLVTIWLSHQLKLVRMIPLMRCSTSIPKKARVEMKWSQKMMHRMHVTRFMRSYVASIATRQLIPSRRSSANYGRSMMPKTLISLRELRLMLLFRISLGCDLMQKIVIFRLSLHKSS